LSFFMGFSKARKQETSHRVYPGGPNGGDKPRRSPSWINPYFSTILSGTSMPVCRPGLST
jgi:hypothetical protein